MFVARVNATVLTQATSGLLALVAAVFLARALGPEGRGSLVAFVVAATIAYAVVNMGVNEASIYFVGSKRLPAPTVAANGLLMAAVAGLVGLLLVVAGVVIAGDRLALGGLPYWTFPLALSLLSTVRLGQAVLQGANRILAMNAVRLAEALARLLAVALLAWAGALTLSSAVGAWLASLALATFLVVVLLGRGHLPQPLAFAFQPKSLLPQFAFGAKTQVRLVAEVVGSRFDLLLLLALAGTGAVGVYAVAIALSEGIRIIANSAATVLTPHLMRVEAQRAGEVAALVARTAVLLTACATGAVASVAPVAIPRLFGPEFSGAVVPLFWLLPGVVAHGASRILGSYFFAVGKPLIGSYVTLVRLVAQVALGSALIPAFGVTGAAAAASGAALAALAWASVSYRRLAGQPALGAVFPRVADLRLYLNLLQALWPSWAPRRASGGGYLTK
ncbi:MAG: oligosaccharide flippase family protein [Dehalococcoidia bacterium]